MAGMIFPRVPKIATAVAWRWPYYCFFDQGSANLTERCHRILQEAVDSGHREREGREHKSDVGDLKIPMHRPTRLIFEFGGMPPMQIM